MRKTAASTQSYTSLVDRWVVEAIARGITRFDQLITVLPGVYPTTALDALQRLVSTGKVPDWILAEAMRQARQTRNHVGNSPHRIGLPIPHPLDYDWRFSDAAVQYLLDKCLQLTHPGETVALLGTPTMLRTAIEQCCPRQWVLLDANPAVIACLINAMPEAQILRCDVRHDSLPELLAPLLIVDPPWYEDDVRSFLWAACQLCAIGGYLVVSLPQEGTRPGIAQEWSHTLDYAQHIGLTFVRVERVVLPYVTPPFERNALRAEGLYALHKEWRRGNLVVFSRTRQVTAPKPLPVYEDDWCEEFLFGMRVRLRRQNEEGFQDPSLIPLVPGDILSSVSRRDERRKLADVWTSGNRIFACQGRNILRQIIQAVAAGRSPGEAIAAYLRRSLSKEEANLVSRSAHVVMNMASLERAENLLFGEG